ncbi:MAG: tripartite tricarboxylate transporter TctB family protein [Hyphomicrobiales bacterium]
MMCINRKVSLVLLAIFGLFFVYSFQYSAEIVAFPRFILAVLALMCVLLFLKPGDLGKIKVTAFLTPPKVITAAFMVAYVAVFPELGFFTTTFLMVFGYVLVFERPARWKALLVALGWVALLYGAFQSTLQIWFPEGVLM